jgi:hypothetical protein
MSPKKRKVTKAEVAGAIDREADRLLRLARELGEERASTPVLDGWSVRDVVAHCVYWQGTLARLMGVRNLPPPAWIPRWQSEQELGTDELNRLTVEHYRRSPFDAVLDDFRFTAALVRRVVDEMKEENLMLPAGDPWGQDSLVWQAIASETHEHWREHADAIEVLLEARGWKGAQPPAKRQGWKGAQPPAKRRGWKGAQPPAKSR